VGSAAFAGWRLAFEYEREQARRTRERVAGGFEIAGTGVVVRAVGRGHHQACYCFAGEAGVCARTARAYAKDEDRAWWPTG
jgi:hypothetical protein